MTILTRYLLRSLTGPFLFAFSLLTGLLFVNTVAQRLEDLVGKGLPREIILEALVLSLPHTIAVTLPMAILPAVLYAFSELASHSEIVAMSSGGVRPRRLFLPVLAFGALLTVVTFVFNDQVLPEANHQLKNLRNSIRQKSPTFQLREQAVNQIEAENGIGPYFLVADAIDQDSSELTGVTIYDMSRQGIRRTTYADRGEMEMNSSFTDLHLRLYDGHVYEVGSGELGTFHRIEFQRQLYVLRGVGDIFEDAGTDQRSDREMSVLMLMEAEQSRQEELDAVRSDSRERALGAVERALGRGTAADSARAAGPPLVKTLSIPGSTQLPSDDVARMLATTARTNNARAEALGRQVNQYRVEVHKKLVIATACIIFVMVGVPVGIRFPQGGVSMVIVVSALVIGIYQWGLTSGEKVADRNLSDPMWSMWAPSVIWFVAGTLLVSRMGRWIASTRSGGWREIWLAVKRLARRSPGKAGAAA